MITPGDPIACLERRVSELEKELAAHVAAAIGVVHQETWIDAKIREEDELKDFYNRGSKPNGV